MGLPDSAHCHFLTGDEGQESALTSEPSAAQIFVEIERARLTKQLAKLKEEEGKVDEAAEILQEVAVVRHSWSTSLSSMSAQQAQLAASKLHHAAGLLQARTA